MNRGFRRLIKPHDPKTWGRLAEYLGVPSLTPGQRLDLAPSQIKDLLECGKDKGLENALFAFADAFTAHVFKDKVYPRAIVEFSNVCTKDCLYCGIRKHMKVHRFTMSQEEVVACAEYAMGQGMGTLMLQSGELPTPARIDYMLDVIRAVRQRTVEMQVQRERGPDARVTEADLARDAQKGLSVALSLGELPSATYQRLFDAGAHRYLLRIETSSPELYARLHPPTHSFQQRLHCLHELQRIGFQVGTGVMVGVPYQRVEHMVQDLLFFRDFQPDMIGLGPYVVQEDTPLGQVWLEQRKGQSEEARKEEAKELFDLTTRMYALARVMLGDVNIAATTALQVLNPVGREIALQRGANVVMPIITPARFRANYEIYANKPCIDEESTKCTRCLNTRVELAGKKLALDGGWYDPPHYRRKAQEPHEEHSEIEKG